jgi:hypothetical protein
MSEPIPESVPTSADPRSKRPLKKRALTPVSAQAATLDALFAKSDQEIKLPPSSSTSLTTAQQHGAPPEIVANVQGSSAGAGSGEFHVYKASRRREYERLRAMDEEVMKEKDMEGWEKERREREERDREKTRKNRERREKLKNRKGKKGASKEDGEDANTGESNVVGGKIKARVDLGKNGPEKDMEMGSGEDGGQEDAHGVIIHDDD